MIDQLIATILHGVMMLIPGSFRFVSNRFEQIGIVKIYQGEIKSHEIAIGALQCIHIEQYFGTFGESD